MDIFERRKRTKIYFARTYRHFKIKRKDQMIFLFGLILPFVFFALLFYTEISKFVVELLARIFRDALPNVKVEISSSEFLPLFGDIYHLNVENKSPTYLEIWINLLATLSLIVISFFAAKNKKKRTPLPIYFVFILLVHLISVIYFLFAKDYFPYTASKYSELYIKQQMIIWISIIAVSGFTLGIIGFGDLKRRILLFFVLMIYSLVFGTVRFITFTYILAVGSTLYMASMFFTLGPLYDFLYFIFLYSVFVNNEIKYFGYGEGRYDWQWL